MEQRSHARLFWLGAPRPDDWVEPHVLPLAAHHLLESKRTGCTREAPDGTNIAAFSGLISLVSEPAPRLVKRPGRERCLGRRHRRSQSALRPHGLLAVPVDTIWMA